MEAATKLLVKDSLTRWMKAPGFLIVLAVALVPPALTGAWVWTHDADIAVVDVSWDRENPEAGDLINISATVRNVHTASVGAFNVTIRVGYYEQAPGGAIRWRDVANETMRVNGLASGTESTVRMNWTTQAGAFQVEAFADFFEEDVPEIEELNNYRPAQIQVRYPQVRPQIEVPPPAGNTTDENNTLPKVNATISSVTWTPEQVYQRDNLTFHVNVANRGPSDLANGTVVFQLYRVTLTGQATPIFNHEVPIDVGAGGNATADISYPNIAIGNFAILAFLDTTRVASGDNLSDNAVIQNFASDRRLTWKEPEEKATAKDFYRSQVLLPLHFTLLVPLIALFYAGGVIRDDQERGNLTYLLTRPVARWKLPITRFVANFGVALIAVLVGILLTYLVLMGTPRADPGYLYWPLLFGIVVLFLYGAVFTLVGVMSERPYLVGLLYILGFESMILAGRRVLVNGQPLAQDWILHGSLLHWIQWAFEGWNPTLAFQVWPEGESAMRALLIILAIGLGSLAASAWIMKRKEFEE